MIQILLLLQLVMAVAYIEATAETDTSTSYFSQRGPGPGFDNVHSPLQDQYKSPCQQHRVFQSSLTSMRSAGTELLNLSFWTALVYRTWHSCWYQTLFTHQQRQFQSRCLRFLKYRTETYRYLDHCANIAITTARLWVNFCVCSLNFSPKWA